MPENQSLLSATGCVMQRGSLEIFLGFQRKMLSAADTCTITEEMRSFGRFKVAQLSMLGRIIDEFLDAKKPLVGFLFSGTTLRRIARRLTDEFDYCSAASAHKQRLILERVRNLPGGNDLGDRLRLRIFTFDTCQGEEAEVCIYSMVATPLRNRLNYVFGRDLTQSHDVEESLRLQRLNVGFSRAKEQIIIFHSKPIADLQGGIQITLSHYLGVLEKGRKGPEVDEVDPNSPMEIQVLNWLREVPVLDELDERVEIDAQFELGVYLRQLDPSYMHPNYKVDFLVKVRGERETAQIVIEYDGFEHFKDLHEVDETNYESYMKPEDVERQKILEGYGYRFIRINRFTKGDDPVKTLDERLRRMLEKLDIERPPPRLIEEQIKLQESLNKGDSKVCSRCSEVKPLADFFDQKLKKGKGGHGRVCRSCKGRDKLPTRPIKKQHQKTSPTARSDDRTYLNCSYSQKD